MHETLSFGRIAGIHVGANWSVLVIAWLITFGLAVGVLPELAPDLATGLYWAAALCAAVVFFGSLLAHELAHAIVARRAGVQVDGIVLWALGGMSEMHEDAPSADVELRVAVVGPLTSLTLGGLFLLLTGAAALVLDGGIVVATLAWLGGVNLLLGVFNLAPAFPLDGGRILRAILWRRSGDRLRATSTAAAAGRVFGYALAGIGALVFMAGAVIDGIWFVVLGWFVVNMARAERAQVEAHELLAGITVGSVMSADPLCVAPNLTLDELLHDYVLTHRYSSYPVVDTRGGALGLVTLETLRRVPATDRSSVTVGAAAQGLDEVAQAAPADLLEEAMASMARTPSRRLLVLDAGRVVGIVSPTDVAGCLQRLSLARGGR